ncbi:MAG TPA: hypothetical protein PKD24_09760 [Pyrinomonadaceae bacterium]|nr:hypothetical protein [Pyrinomonadaceae bacterium]HMP65645.1 hypothetical protein [Pyrinomonadaceae bacterium]
MFYRPKFCCECGEKIERVEWKIWTSRRFCEFCETEYKGHDLGIRGIVAGGALLGIFGLSSYLGLGRQPASSGMAPRPLAPAAKSAPVARKEVPQGPMTRREEPASIAADNENERTTEPVQGDVRKVSEQPSASRASSEKVSYFCGVTTRKGTPCSRRVKSKGSRCWQHEAVE